MSTTLNNLPIDRNLSKGDFERINRENIHDAAFQTKPVSYLRDCFRRFRKNKGSVVAGIIILMIALYAIIVPLVSPRSYTGISGGYYDDHFAYVLPYNPMFAGTGFWDGTEVKTLDESTYIADQYSDSNHPYIVELLERNETRVTAGSTVYVTVMYRCRVDSYADNNIASIRLSAQQMSDLEAYEKEKGIWHSGSSIVKPQTDVEGYLAEYRVTLAEYMNTDASSSTVDNVIAALRTSYNQNPSFYYELTAVNPNTGAVSDTRFWPVMGEDGAPKDIYRRDANGELVYSTYQNQQYTVRVDYFDYSTYYYGYEPYYYFGANGEGRDIFLRLAEGARFSLLLGVCISAINFIIGLIWGAISGYYGGTADLVMERITDVIGNVPSIVVLTVCSVSFTSNQAFLNSLGAAGVLILSVLLSFVMSGWIGTASTTRMQFYRFKGQEYVLASRTLGAKDSRLIFRHILPNAAGTLVTSSVLMIPGVIFSETSLSYLGLINFSTSGLVSIGSLLYEGQVAGLQNYPHMLLFPCIAIALLMICFNLFGNGLRDAFNTTLKGAED